MQSCLAEVPFLCSVIPSKLNEPQAPSQAARPDQPTAQVTVAANWCRWDSCGWNCTVPLSPSTELSGSGPDVQWDSDPSGHRHAHVCTRPRPRAHRRTAILHCLGDKYILRAGNFSSATSWRNCTAPKAWCSPWSLGTGGCGLAAASRRVARRCLCRP